MLQTIPALRFNVKVDVLRCWSVVRPLAGYQTGAEFVLVLIEQAQKES